MPDSMKQFFVVKAVILICIGSGTAQTLYVDGNKKSNGAHSTSTAPINSLQKAVALASTFSGNEPVTIKLAPGFYELNEHLNLQTKNNDDGASTYILEV